MRVTREFRIRNRLGLHARAAAQFVRLASRFSSDVTVAKDGYEVNGKSILGLLSLAAVKGTTIVVTIEGNDAEEVLSEVESLIETGFGEGVEE